MWGPQKTTMLAGSFHLSLGGVARSVPRAWNAWRRHGVEALVGLRDPGRRTWPREPDLCFARGGPALKPCDAFVARECVRAAVGLVFERPPERDEGVAVPLEHSCEPV